MLTNFKIALGEDRCLKNQFTGTNKRGTSYSNTCNGANDCGDNSDEIHPCSGINFKMSKYYIL